MAVILEVERSKRKAKIFLAGVYSLLIIGAITMIYPFAVMLTASISSAYDYQRHEAFPRALMSESERFMRSLATYWRVFPRTVYPDAPAAWTSWGEIAKDREGVKNFAQRELAPYRERTARAIAARAAREDLATLALAPSRLTVCNPDAREIAGFVQQKYGSLEKLNAAWPVRHRSFFDVSFATEAKLPSERTEGDDEKSATWRELKQSYLTRAIARGDFAARTMPTPSAANAKTIRRAMAVQFLEHGWRDYFESAFANYRLVGDYLFHRGRAFGNTLLLVILSILASLTVNPLAAYALSRFKLKATEQILLFLLATMAFPAAVTAIPGFLLIRDLGLLNTFAALVLPTVASGMSIFILKGFFDALPRELYEAATIDGAGEWTVFTRITLPMTTPILAVNALNAFIHAYSSWEWAFLVCQKESHWTLAVWMYQMSQTFAHQPWCVMAAFAVVSIPTATVFLLCQRVILKGIVLPSMK